MFTFFNELCENSGYFHHQCRTGSWINGTKHPGISMITEQNVTVCKGKHLSYFIVALPGSGKKPAAPISVQYWGDHFPLPSSTSLFPSLPLPPFSLTPLPFPFPLPLSPLPLPLPLSFPFP